MMINILCYGDSNTWGNIAGSRKMDLMLAKRFDRDTRWTGILQQKLGNKFYVIEAGLNGRNTSFNEVRFKRPSRNGLETLPLILEMNYPLNLVIIMLGTNDSLVDFKATPKQTTEALRKMIQYIKGSHLGPKFTAPRILLVAPVPIHKIDSDDFNLFFDDESVKNTESLATFYAELAAKEKCEFLNAKGIANVSHDDGVHIDKKGHLDLATAIAAKIQIIFPNESK
jgi:lysophospholipase L1-like esterase